jgi:acyl-[acyl-carrier-protein]-phospholipid O-acyltransferase/long-chain-fatty-acid--[acyl-carrier-protein] ligase
MLSRRFAPLFWCQFFAAFNDNFLKTSLVFLFLFRSGAAGAEALVTLASAVFIAPYFFLSALGGELADRHDKAQVAQWLKFLEMFVAALAVLGFARQSAPILFGALVGFGMIGALFGPIKYGILPDHLVRAELPAGNALVEGATFVAILTGTLIGGLAARGGGSVTAFAVLVIGFAFLCWAASLLIPPTGAGAPQLKISVNIAASTLGMIRHLRADPRLWWGAMVTSWFWLVGIVVLSLLPPLIKILIGGNEDTVTAYLALFSIAVGAGSGLAAAIARGRIVLKTTLAGAVLLGAFALDLGMATYGVTPALAPQTPAAVFSSALGIRIAFDLSGLAVAGGLFIVPAFAAVQAWAGADYRARTVAAVNVLNAAFMTGATVVVAILQKYGVTVPTLFLMIGAATFLVALAIWRTMPKAS